VRLTSGHTPSVSRYLQPAAGLIRAQCARRREPLATRIKVRKAVLTDCPSGKYAATSGERSTRFVPVRKRATYFPRTPPFKLDRSYSRRNSPRRPCFSVLFFMLFSLALRCLTGANNSNDLVAVHVGHDQNSARARHSDCDKPLFRCGMIRVGIRFRERITEHGCGFVE
jgi:hypothetical protein